ncbi:glucose-6-phosphate dehydrogenase [Anaerobacillus alkaliphilus]|uniref:Glucose-6-phosphate 1-dehydrogenase n=1 Tax=Anaerobacillus alkaliphilus TaxID=1548597 RepID=A0A4Q0VP22_9BACI|nr:glucose-6-phosphate dehydrogenase [Anaerobacillus alkaliphilus]RXI97781.1 glucose-6-phosphate dehydrogenase [Anaerobacillus alkaliphilus]
MEITEQVKTIVVIFGATGDLAKRKLFPSIYNLYSKGQLSEKFAVVGIGRRELSQEEFQTNVVKSVGTDNAYTREFSQHFYYHPFDVTNRNSYVDLKGQLVQLDEEYQVEGNRIFYLAMAPEFFGEIAQHLKREGLTNTSGYSRLIIEKPFGHNLPSAQLLNEQISQAFTEDQIYRIDHYLGKEMVQNIEVIRFANAIFEPLWNNRYIANIQITSSEVLGVEDRGGYYEKSGALRDMVQNHMLQMVSLLAMEPPIKLTTDEIRSEKIKVLRAMRPVKETEVHEYFVRGQYSSGEINGERVIGYREENNVSEKSTTETYVAGKILIDNFRWANVPFYIRTGKRMKEKSTKIVVQFKDIPMNLYYNNSEQHLNPNLLVIHIQPMEGITLSLNAKRQGKKIGIAPVKLDYCNNCEDVLNTPEAYEKLLYDCVRGDATNFTHWNEVALSWQFVDPISRIWENDEVTSISTYPAGTMGPDEANVLLAKDDFHWWSLSDSM